MDVRAMILRVRNCSYYSYYCIGSLGDQNLDICDHSTILLLLVPLLSFAVCCVCRAYCTVLQLNGRPSMTLEKKIFIWLKQ